MKTIIMAGGRGTRISALFPDIPKPLIPISDPNGITKPVLEWEIENLRDQGYSDIILTVGYMAQKVIDHFGDGSELDVNIKYLIEDTPLGNVGALIKYRELLGGDPFLLLIADALFDVDFNRMVEYHYAKGGLVTLFAHPNSHPYDSSLLLTDRDEAVISWLTREDERPEFYRNRVNAGLQVIDPVVLYRLDIDPDLIGKKDEKGNIIKVDMDRQLLKPLCNTGQMFVYDSSEYCKDMGTPERFDQVSRDFASGNVTAKNLGRPQKVIFILEGENKKSRI